MRNNTANPRSMASAGRPWRGRPDTTDEALIGKIAAGNRLALQVLYARHHSRIHRFLTRLVGDDAAAEQILTEVFVSAWRHARRFEGRMAASTWLLAIARRKAYAALRRAGNGSLPADRADASPAGIAGKGAAGKGDAGKASLRDPLVRLSREQREIIDLVYYHRQSMREIADIVGISEHAVELRMREARSQLAALSDRRPAAD